MSARSPTTFIMLEGTSSQHTWVAIPDLHFKQSLLNLVGYSGINVQWIEIYLLLTVMGEGVIKFNSGSDLQTFTYDFNFGQSHLQEKKRG